MGGGGGVILNQIPEQGVLENLDKNLLFEVNCTETCLCITDSLSHVETNNFERTCLGRLGGGLYGEVQVNKFEDVTPCMVRAGGLGLGGSRNDEGREAGVQGPHMTRD